MKFKSRRIFAVLLAFLFTFSYSFNIAVPANGAEKRKILTGWIPYYQMKNSLPAALSYNDVIKEVMPFWYTLKISNGNVTISDLYSPGNPSVPMAEPLNAMRGAGYKIYPTITDGTNKLELAKYLATPANRTKVVTAIVNLVNTNGFDGIDLDFENFAFVDGNTSWPTTKPLWISFINELSTSLHVNQKVLSVTTPYLLDPATGKQGYYVYAWADISPFIDRLRIMTYDYNVARPGPLGPLAWVEETTQYAIKVIPASKIYLGLAGFGRDWVTAVSGVCPSNVASIVKVGAKAAEFYMSNAPTLAATYGATPTYNQQYGEMNFTYQKTYTGTTSTGLATSCTASRSVWYFDAQSYLARTQFVGKYRLGGVTIWTLGMVDPMAMNSIQQVASSIAPDQILGAISLSAEELGYGQVTNLSGIYTLPDKTPVVGLQVKVEVKLPNESSWREIGSLITGSDGTVSTGVLLGKNQKIRLHTLETWEKLESVTSEKTISVKPLLTVSAPISANKSQLFTITGTLSPKLATKINLESFVFGKWKVINSASSDESGNYSFNVGSSVSGFARYRTSTLANDLIGAASSQEAVVVIRD